MTQPMYSSNSFRLCYLQVPMTLPVLVADALDDDRPKRPDPLEDSLCSAQQRRYLKTLCKKKNDYD